MNISNLVNNGEIKTYDTGAQRDLPEIHGRCDLMPLHVINCLAQSNNKVLEHLDGFVYKGGTVYLYLALNEFISTAYEDRIDAILDLSRHYKNCLVKYPERNWEKGIPVHSYIDSAVRHFLKWTRKDEDENHAVAVLWNLVCALWTLDNLPTLNDMPHNLKKKGETNNEKGTSDNFPR